MEYWPTYSGKIMDMNPSDFDSLHIFMQGLRDYEQENKWYFVESESMGWNMKESSRKIRNTK